MTLAAGVGGAVQLVKVMTWFAKVALFKQLVPLHFKSWGRSFVTKSVSLSCSAAAIRLAYLPALIRKVRRDFHPCVVDVTSAR